MPSSQSDDIFIAKRPQFLYDAGGFAVFYPIKQIFFFVLNIELFQKAQIFLPEGLLFMMLFLPMYIGYHLIQLRMPIRKGPETLLPVKLILAEPFLIYKIVARFFYLPNEI